MCAEYTERRMYAYGERVDVCEFGRTRMRVCALFPLPSENCEGKKWLEKMKEKLDVMSATPYFIFFCLHHVFFQADFSACVGTSVDPMFLSR